MGASPPGGGDPLAAALGGQTATGEHFGFDADGGAWVSEAALAFVGEADRSHLVKKVITNRAGHKQTVYVRQAGPPPKGERPSPARASPAPCHRRGMATPQYTAERFQLPATPLRVDREKCVVYGVRVVGPKSKNGHKYPDAYLRSALAKIDGADCNWGHHRDAAGNPVEAPPDKKLGRHLNPRIDNGGIHTDLKYNPKNAHAEEFLWACENDPAMLSFSQLALVKWQPQPDADGDLVAESCLDFASGDVVGRGGATSTVFESYTREAAMAKTYDPKEVAASLETTGAKIDFLTAFISSLSGVDQPTKDQIVQMVVTAMTASAPAPDPNATDPNAVAPVMNSLQRFGPVGAWAAKHLTSYFAAEAAAKRKKWAADLIAAEQVPAGLVTDVFTETVAESFGNESRAKALIADRKALSAGAGDAGGSGGGGGGPKTAPATGSAVSVKDLVAGYAAG